MELLQQSPSWAEGYRHASGSLAEAGAIESAADYAVEACVHAPKNMEWVLHAGVLLLRAGRVEAAVGYLRYAVHLQPENCRALREAAAAHYAVGHHEQAAAFAERSIALAPEDTATAVFAAELLLRCSRADAAVRILYSAAARDRADPVLLRTLSAAEMERGCFPDALAAIDAALAIVPENAEYNIHRGHVLVRLGEFHAAEVAFDRAAVLDPTNPDLMRALIDLYLTQGRISEATALGGGLLHRRPDDPTAAQTVLHVLGERLNSIDADYVVVHDGAERPPRPFPPLPGFFDRLRNQRRVIRALIIRETRTRFGESRLGYGWALLEPILHIALLSAVFSVLMRGQPPIGSHFFLFYYTGLVPYHAFVHTSSGMAHAITSNAALLQLPLVTTFDVIVARGLLEIITDVIVAAIMLLGFGLAGLAATPDDWWTPLTAFLAIALFGCGIGYINAVVSVFWRGWDKIYAQVTRALYFISGIFRYYVAAATKPAFARASA